MARQRVEPLLASWADGRWRPHADTPSLRLELGRWDHADQIDALWPGGRADDALNRNWTWRKIFDVAQIRVVGLIDDTVVFAFACKRGYLKPGPTPCLRLDYLEVAPAYRGKGWGKLALGLVAELARHKDCKALLLGALPDPAVLSFYKAIGAWEDGFPIPWSPGEQELVPLYCGRETLDALEGWTSEQREDV